VFRVLGYLVGYSVVLVLAWQGEVRVHVCVVCAFNNLVKTVLVCVWLLCCSAPSRVRVWECGLWEGVKGALNTTIDLLYKLVPGTYQVPGI
jgi:hypothetical protein